MKLCTKVICIGASAWLMGCVSQEEPTEVGGEMEAALRCVYDSETCVLDDLGDDDKREILEEGCWITGGGHIGDANARPGAGKNRQDSFGFNAMGMKDGRVRGEIQNTNHLGDVFHGHATWIRCWKDDGPGPQVPKAVPNNAEWGGHGSWNHEDGYTWRAHIADRREGGSRHDEYEIWVWAADGILTYSQTWDEDRVIAGGNFQIHPPNNGHPYVSGDAP